MVTIDYSDFGLHREIDTKTYLEANGMDESVIPEFILKTMGGKALLRKGLKAFKFVSKPNSLSFRFPKRMVDYPGGKMAPINYVKVTFKPSVGNYLVEFGFVVRSGFKRQDVPIIAYDGLAADEITGTFGDINEITVE